MDGRVREFPLGAHPPSLTAEDVEHIHRLWLDAVTQVGPDVHHRDIVTAALASFEDELRGDQAQALARLRKPA